MTKGEGGADVEAVENDVQAAEANDESEAVRTGRVTYEPAKALARAKPRPTTRTTRSDGESHRY
eukprot:CAMPEP_0119545008 /NCGR_PEP_ID=MMETSP1344-20130328/55022_1 /TAXON_ID=236787 /ORGANISM="Florenciella parvula, Strain CCMP2471" /LENGTH=63 /DNA_ID=CAMNT_0007589521 /DNA_START=127 /DNA_END=319 /DNA_ORIENTATION=-